MNFTLEVRHFPLALMSIGELQGHNLGNLTRMLRNKGREGGREGQTMMDYHSRVGVGANTSSYFMHAT